MTSFCTQSVLVSGSQLTSRLVTRTTQVVEGQVFVQIRLDLCKKWSLFHFAGTTDNSLDLTEEQLKDLEVDMVDIVNDQVAAHHYKEKEDLRNFKSGKTGRGPYENEGDQNLCKFY